MKKKIKKKKTYKQLKAELDKVFSLFIRYRDGGVCFTCGKIGAIKEMQNGHFFSRTHLGTRWDERNCHCQCVGCNIFKHGNLAVYSMRLKEKYVDENLEDLFEQSKKLIKLSRADLEIKIDYYRLHIYQYENPNQLMRF